MAKVRYDGITDADLLARTREDPEAFGIVPDGVASVVLELPGHRGKVTARVVNNVYMARIPRSISAPTRVVWLAADGGVIRTTRVP